MAGVSICQTSKMTPINLHLLSRPGLKTNKCLNRLIAIKGKPVFVGSQGQKQIKRYWGQVFILDKLVKNEDLTPIVADLPIDLPIDLNNNSQSGSILNAD